MWKASFGVTGLTIWDLRRYYIITRKYVNNKYNRIRRIKIYQIEYIIMDLLKSTEIKDKLSCWQISKIKLQAIILLGFKHIWFGFRLALNTDLDRVLYKLSGLIFNQKVSYFLILFPFLRYFRKPTWNKLWKMYFKVNLTCIRPYDICALIFTYTRTSEQIFAKLQKNR